MQKTVPRRDRDKSQKFGMRLPVGRDCGIKVSWPPFELTDILLAASTKSEDGLSL